MNSKMLFLVGLCLVISHVSFSQGSDIRYEAWQSVSTEFKILKDMEGGVELATRERLEDGGSLDVAYAECFLGYEILKSLDLKGFFRYGSDFDEETGSRVGGLLDFSVVSTKRWKLISRFRYEVNWKEDETIGRVRLRLKPQYRKKDWKFFVAAEAFFPEQDGLDKMRYKMGSAYDLNKRSRLQLSLAYEDREKASRADVGIVSVDYKYMW